MQYRHGQQIEAIDLLAGFIKTIRDEEAEEIAKLAEREAECPAATNSYRSSAASFAILIRERIRARQPLANGEPG